MRIVILVSEPSSLIIAAIESPARNSGIEERGRKVFEKEPISLDGNKNLSKLFKCIDEYQG